MGDVVALSLYESLRKPKNKSASLGAEADVLMFTGVRYERMAASHHIGSMASKGVGCAIQRKANSRNRRTRSKA